MSRKKGDSRYHGIITYPDNYELNEQLKQYEHACILHDLDTWTDEDEKSNSEHKSRELKKPHIHWVLRFANTRSESALSKELGLNFGRVQAISSFKAQMRYLIHFDDPDKHQYDKSQIEHTFPIESFFRDYVDYDDGFVLICDFIMNNPDPVDFRTLTQFALVNNCSNVVRRYAYYFNCLLRDIKK